MISALVYLLLLVYNLPSLHSSQAWCKAGSTCTHHGSFDPVIGNVGFCTCNHGFGGPCCENDINECHSNPCQHGGHCNDKANGYTCTCRLGYGGHNCQIDINECQSNPCQHGGHCFDNVNGYTCLCRPGYGGNQCQIDVDECASNPCQNSGTCTDKVNGYTCSCRGGYTGKLCETEINACDRNPCAYGICHRNMSSFYCECKAGFHGVDCSKELDECASSPCMNGATCVDRFNDYLCECLPGDSGKNCEIASVYTEKPKITLPEILNINEGTREIHIPCTVEGLPAPTVKWEAVSGRLQNNIQQIDHFLVLDNVTIADGGFYTCIATNRIGADAKVIHIIVTADSSRPYTAPVISAQSMVVANYYTEAVLVCNVTGHPEPRIKWQYNQHVPDIQISGGTLRIPNVTQEAQGIYTCIASNDIGSSRANINLETRYDLPKIVSGPEVFTGRSGDAHNFTCTVTGHPTPTITWTFNSFSHEPLTLPQHNIYNNGMTIELLHTDTSGIILCTATNEFGSVHSSAHVITHIRFTLFLSCTASYDMCGDESLCDQHGTWSLLIGSSGICVCYYGYNGYCCQTDIDECTSNPCHNSALCVDGVNRFTCTCPAGYAGKRCEININECASNPCQVNEICTDYVNKYTCTCRPGFTGHHCETDIDECFSNPCQNHATCIDGIGSYTCQCSSGYHGNNCEIANIDFDDCSSNPCIYGYCLDGINSYTCFCRPGFTGTNCNSEINECLSQPCKYGGTCIDQHRGYTCICHDGESGLTCEKVSSITEAPHISEMRDVTVSEGSSILKIPCFAEGIPVPDIKCGSITGTFQHNVHQVAHFLIIENVMLSDAGYYTCTAVNRIGSDVKAVHVIVKARQTLPLVAPVITAPSRILAVFYTSVILTCNVTGSPTPDVRWEFNGKQIFPTNTTLTSRVSITVQNVTSDTTGQYTCEATNDAGSARANIFLEARLEKPQIIQPPHSLSAVQGSDHNFTCGFTGSPLPIVTWTFQPFSQEVKTNHFIHAIYSGNNVSIISYNLKSSGVLTCTVNNTLGIDSAMAHIIVKNTPPIIGRR